jgi:hypothetical protein
MDLQNSLLVLTHQAALAPDYAFAVAAIALLIFCASVLYKARTVDQLRRTGEKHDHLRTRDFNSAREKRAQRIAEGESVEISRSDRIQRTPHPWTHT